LPRLAAALGGPWTTKNIGPLLDHTEVVTFGSAIRGGQTEFAQISEVTEEALRHTVRAAKQANRAATIGLSVWVAVGDSEVATFVAEAYAGSVFEGLSGHAAMVVDKLRRVSELTPTDRLTVVPPVPGTVEALGPLLHHG
jgi:hypothetical protein